MDDSELDNELQPLGNDRRTFLKRLAVGAAFATPIVSSFSMSGLSVNAAAAQSGTTSLGGN